MKISANIKEKFIKEITDVIKKTKDFTLEQLPDVAQQLVMYGRVVYGAIFGVSLLLGFISFYCGVHIPSEILAVNVEGHNGSAEGFLVAHAMVGLISGIGALCMFCENANNIVAAFFAPKIFILRELGVL